MVSTRTRWRGPLERASPALFVLAGALLVALLVLGLLVRFQAVSIPRTSYWPMFPLAIALSLVGLLGLYPRLAERARRPAIAGAGFAAIGATLLLGGLGVLLVVSPPGPYPGKLGVLGAPFFLGLLAFVPAVVTYGLVGLRTDTPSRRLAGLLLLVGGLQLVELVGAAAVFPSAGTAAPSGYYLLFEVGVYGLIATAMVAAGYALHRDAGSPGARDRVDAPTVPAEVP